MAFEDLAALSRHERVRLVRLLGHPRLSRCRRAPAIRTEFSASLPPLRLRTCGERAIILIVPLIVILLLGGKPVAMTSPVTNCRKIAARGRGSERHRQLGREISNMDHAKLSLRVGLAVLAMGAGLLVSGTAASEDVDMYDGQWRAGITPYLWLPSVHGTANLNLPSGSTTAAVEINPGSYLSDLQFGFMAAGQVRKGDFAFIYDLIFADLKGNNSRVRTLHGPDGHIELPFDANVNSRLDSSIVTLGGSYTMAHTDQGSIDVFAAAAITDIRASADWNLAGPDGIFQRSGSVGQTNTFTQGVFGVQGHVRLSDDGKWYMPYEVDGRVGSNSSGWNGIIGIGYRYSWGDVVVAFRNLYLSMNDDRLIKNTRLIGPAVGASFRW
jgi:hypothetical protein